MQAWRQDVERPLRERIAVLEEALEPLAAALDSWPHAVHSDRDIGRMNYDTGITEAHVLRARAALANRGKERDGG
jgi:hypothetical protein